MNATLVSEKKMQCSTRAFDLHSGTIPAVVLSTSRSVNKTSGGVGICAQEYLRTLAAAGFKLEIVAFDTDNRPFVRLKRKLWPQSYADMIPPTVATETATIVRNTGARFLFLHMTDTAPLAGTLRARLGPDIRLVLLSHGMESVDYLHKLRIQKEVTSISRPPRLRRGELARQLCTESAQRQHIDHVLTLSPVEANIEQWLGAKAVTWVPRTITARPLAWDPLPGRIGFVGGVDHLPNVEGLLLFARALESIVPVGLRLRVVGGPESSGRSFAQRFPFLDFLGPLDDAQLETEAQTWNCFVNPIFCYPRGCSTKLAVGLGWHIPVVSTTAGRRGYVWDSGELPTAETPEGLAHLAVSMLNRDTAEAARREVRLIAGSAPSLDEVAAKIRSALLSSKPELTLP